MWYVLFEIGNTDFIYQKFFKNYDPDCYFTLLINQRWHLISFV